MRPTNVPLMTLCFLSEFVPHIGHALNATASHHTRTSLPGPRRECPAITQLESTGTFGLERSQISPDASPPAPPCLNILISSVKAKVFRREKKSVCVGLARHATNAANSCNKTRSHCSKRKQWHPTAWLWRGFDISYFNFFETNDFCLNEEKEHESSSERDLRIKVPDKNSTGHVTSMSSLRPTIPAAPAIP